MSVHGLQDGDACSCERRGNAPHGGALRLGHGCWHRAVRDVFEFVHHARELAAMDHAVEDHEAGGAVGGDRSAEHFCLFLGVLVQCEEAITHHTNEVIDSVLIRDRSAPV